MNPFENIPETPPNGYNAQSSTGSHDLQTRIKMSMDRQLQGTNRCIASIHESESVGFAAAQELSEQGEKLDRAEQNVDKIIQDTKQSQRHLNSIKSVFGGIKNWWSGSDKTPTHVEPASRTSRPLDKVLETPRNNNTPHPLINKRADTMGFYDEDVKDYNEFKLDEDLRPRQTQAPSRPPPSSAQKTTKSNLWDEYERGLESNLSQMSSGLSNLKMLAEGMKVEIDTQNTQLDRITDKVDRSDAKVRNQNMQMKKILGK